MLPLPWDLKVPSLLPFGNEDDPIETEGVVAFQKRDVGKKSMESGF